MIRMTGLGSWPGITIIELDPLTEGWTFPENTFLVFDVPGYGISNSDRGTGNFALHNICFTCDFTASAIPTRTDPVLY